MTRTASVKVKRTRTTKTESVVVVVAYNDNERPTGAADEHRHPGGDSLGCEICQERAWPPGFDVLLFGKAVRGFKRPSPSQHLAEVVTLPARTTKRAV